MNYVEIKSHDWIWLKIIQNKEKRRKKGKIGNKYGRILINAE